MLKRLFVCCLLAAAAFSLAGPAEDAAAGVMARTFPSVAKHFRFEPLTGEMPAYKVVARAGTVVVKGTDGVSMCRGAYDYLRQAVGAQATWSGTSLGSGLLPDLEISNVSPYRYVLQDNVCTFGYTTAFYGWKEWERYLDVMALHGVNTEFSPIGGEAIWKRVWQKFGVSANDLDDFFTGPAFLPWHRMGNVNKHDGPLSDSYLKQSIALEKKILRRMLTLGMVPVAPAFAGFVPGAFAKAHPKEDVIHVGSWAGFQGDNRTWILNPLSPMYREIGGEFVREWTQEFGPTHFYLADSFNELEVPVPPERDRRLETLAQFGQAVYDGIHAGDPAGTWVMQGWLFYNSRDFWDKDSVRALLSRIPDDRMMILDLFAEYAPIWKLQDAFYGKPWILSNITTWGGNNQAYGNFDLYSRLSADTLAAPGHGKLVGYGMSFEGSESNEVQYELMCDSAWSSRPIDLDRFIAETCRSRYGAADPHAIAAWQLFRKSVYAMSPGQHPNHLLQSRPHEITMASHGAVNDSPAFKEGVARLVQADKGLWGNPLYRADVIQMVSQWALLEADNQLKQAVTAQSLGLQQESEAYLARFMEFSHDGDRLLASHPLDRLDRWKRMARAWGTSEFEKDRLASDAKRQVTVWGGPDLSEYAAKMWSGLIGSYYVPRWTEWFRSREKGQGWDSKPWEEQWIVSPNIDTAQPFDDPMASAMEIVRKLQRVEPPDMARLLGTQVGEWKSGEQNETYRERSWDITKQAGVSDSLDLSLVFQYTSGACRLDIDGVQLLENGVVVASDPHFGRTGLEDVDNVFHLKWKPHKRGSKYEIRARVRSDGGEDSNGLIYLRSL